MNPFVTQETYDVEIDDPRDRVIDAKDPTKNQPGTKWNAKLRILNAGDRAAIQDETVIETTDDGTDRSRVPMGSLRMKTVQLALVSWDLPLPPTAQTIATLHPALFDQIYEAVRLGGDVADPPTEAQTASPSPEPPAGDAS